MVKENESSSTRKDVLAELRLREQAQNAIIPAPQGFKDRVMARIKAADKPQQSQSKG